MEHQSIHGMSQVYNVKEEEAFRNIEITSRALLESSPVCNKVISLDSRLLYMSAAGVKQLKIPDIKPFYGCTYPPEFYPESMRTPLINHLQRAIAGEASSLECPVLDMEGGEVWYHTTFVPARDDEGQIVYVIATSVDITERKQAEEALRKNEAVLSKAQEISHIGSFEWNVTRDQIVWSDEMLQIYGISRDEFGGSIADVLPLIHPDDRVRIQEGIERAMKEGTKENGMEYRIVRPDGTCRTVFGQAEYLQDADRAADRMVGFVQDITERKQAEQAEEALHNQQAALAHASRVASIGELTSGIVHEISQPLYAISNFSGACRRTLEGVEFEGSAEVADCLDRITQATTTAQEILVRLRGYLKRQDVQRFMVELSEAIEEVLKLLAFKIRSHGVTVDCDLAPETRVFADPVQLQQVLVNLILNACDALETVPTEARRILIRAAIVDNEVEVAVEDNGIGISEEAAEHLFDPFFTTKADGLGVGMAVTKGIISRHDGKIWFTSPPHKGTTFHFTLPVFQDQ